MKNNIIDIFCIITLILVILGVSIYIYNSVAAEENSLDVMVENLPQENIIEENDEDELVVGHYEIEGKNYEVVAVLKIPSLGIEYPVLSSTSKELLKVSINKYWGPAPNTVGNYCVVGHNYKSKKMFGRLSEAVNGDIIELEDMLGNVVKYAVYDRYTVQPTNTACTSQLTNGRREVTLITCTNYGKERLIVKAREIK